MHSTYWGPRPHISSTPEIATRSLLRCGMWCTPSAHSQHCQDVGLGHCSCLVHPPVMECTHCRRMWQQVLRTSTVLEVLAIISTHAHTNTCAHACSQMLQTPTVREVLTEEDHLALLIAALCHDLDHDGHSNSYHSEWSWRREGGREGGRELANVSPKLSPKLSLPSMITHTHTHASAWHHMHLHTLVPRSQHPVRAVLHLQRHQRHGESPRGHDLCCPQAEG